MQFNPMGHGKVPVASAQTRAPVACGRHRAVPILKAACGAEALGAVGERGGCAHRVFGATWRLVGSTGPVEFEVGNGLAWVRPRKVSDHCRRRDAAEAVEGVHAANQPVRAASGFAELPARNLAATTVVARGRRNPVRARRARGPTIHVRVGRIAPRRADAGHSEPAWLRVHCAGNGIAARLVRLSRWPSRGRIRASGRRRASIRHCGRIRAPGRRRASIRRNAGSDRRPPTGDDE